MSRPALQETEGLFCRRSPGFPAGPDAMTPLRFMGGGSLHHLLHKAKTPLTISFFSSAPPKCNVFLAQVSFLMLNARSRC